MPDVQGIVLIGFMGAGKSTVADQLRSLSHLPVIDLDQLIVERRNQSIPEIFAGEGEPAFRDYESQALESLCHGKSIILATGGGVVGREQNWDLMRRIGRVVWLDADWETLCRRIGDGEGRPLAGDVGRREQLKQLWESRLPLYAQADLVIDATDMDASQIAEAILEQMNMENGND